MEKSLSIRELVSREACPFCTRKHLAAARRFLWELPNHADDYNDPHLEGLIGELEHAEMQCPYDQVAQKIRKVKLFFDENAIWCGQDLVYLSEETDELPDLDALLVEAMMELREIARQERDLQTELLDKKEVAE